MVIAKSTSKAGGDLEHAAFLVECPYCGGDAGSCVMPLNDVEAVECTACSQTFSPVEAVAKLAEKLRRWQDVARWARLVDRVQAEGQGEAPGL